MPGRFPQPCDNPNSDSCIASRIPQTRGNPLVVKTDSGYVPGSAAKTPEDRKAVQGLIDKGYFSPEDDDGYGGLNHFFKGITKPAAYAIGSAVVSTAAGEGGEWLYANGYLSTGAANKSPGWVTWLEKTIASTATSLGIGKLINKKSPTGGSPPINIFADRGSKGGPALTPFDNLFGGGSGSGGGGGGGSDSSSTLFTPMNIALGILALIAFIFLVRR